LEDADPVGKHSAAFPVKNTWLISHQQND
jgi:hypothetical protein